MKQLNYVSKCRNNRRWTQEQGGRNPNHQHHTASAEE